jgi:hypothetical protein
MFLCEAEGFEHQTEENVTQIIDLGSLELNVKWRKTLNWGTLNEGSTV